eukprot:357575-Chlamydomonas_euryale.AAC.2
MALFQSCHTASSAALPPCYFAALQQRLSFQVLHRCSALPHRLFCHATTLLFCRAATPPLLPRGHTAFLPRGHTVFHTATLLCRSDKPPGIGHTVLPYRRYRDPADGIACLVMGYCEGGTLSSLLRVRARGFRSSVVSVPWDLWVTSALVTLEGPSALSSA